MISKMKSTKVEFQEINSSQQSPQVQEVDSYSYIIQEDSNSVKQENGVLVEEFSESEDNASKLQVNRGISIVSISDDDSTLKGISRDVSSDDIACFELTEDLKLTNGSRDEYSARITEERGTEHHKFQRGTLLSETILEEKSVNESLSENPEVKLFQKQESVISRQSSVFDESKLSRQSSTKTEIFELSERENSVIEETKISRQNSIKSNGDLSRQQSITVDYAEFPEKSTDILEKSKLIKQNCLKEKTVSRETSIIEEVEFPEKQNGHMEESVFTRQSSVKEKLCRQISNKQETSKLTESQNAKIEESTLLKQTTIKEKIASRQNSINVTDSNETSDTKAAIISNLSRENSINEKNSFRKSSIKEGISESVGKQNGVFDNNKYNSETLVKERSLSRQNSKSNGTTERRSSSRSIINDDEEEEDEEMRKLFARIKRQRSVLDEILEKQEGKKENEEFSSLYFPERYEIILNYLYLG